MYIPKGSSVQWGAAAMQVRASGQPIVTATRDGLVIVPKPPEVSDRIYNETLNLAAVVLGGQVVRVRGRSYMELDGQLIPATPGDHECRAFAKLMDTLLADA